MQVSNTPEINLFDIAPYFRAIWKYKWLIISLLLLAVGITVAINWQEKPNYLATAYVKIGKVWDLPVGDPNVVVELVTKQPFLLRVNEKLTKKKNIGVLSRAVTAEKLEAGRGRARYVYLIRLTGRGASPELAQDLVKAVAEEVIAENDLVYNKAYSVYEKQEKDLQTKIEEIKNKISLNLPPIELYEKRLELHLLEQQLAETQINNQSVLKTFRTALAEELEPAKQIPGSNIYKLILIAAGTSVALGILIALVLDFGWSKATTRSN